MGQRVGDRAAEECPASSESLALGEEPGATGAGDVEGTSANS